MKKVKGPKAQGSLEYLLLIGGAVLVVITVIFMLLNIVGSLRGGVIGGMGEWIGVIAEQCGSTSSTIPVILTGAFNNPVSQSFNLSFSGTPKQGTVTWDCISSLDCSWNDTYWHCFYIDDVLVNSSQTMPTIGSNNGFEVTNPFLLTPGSHILSSSSGLASCSDTSDIDWFIIDNIEITVEHCT